MTKTKYYNKDGKPISEKLFLKLRDNDILIYGRAFFNRDVYNDEVQYCLLDPAVTHVVIKHG